MTLASDVRTSVWSQPVTLTATVTPAGATGTVTFRDSLAVLGTAPLVGGNAQLTRSTLTPGAHTRIVAVYVGDACDVGVTSPPETQLVYRAATTLAITTDVNPSLWEQSVRLTATVSPTGATNRVFFFDAGNPIGSANINVLTGVATLFVSNLLPGTHALTASYTGDTRYEPSSTTGPYTQVVNRAPTSVSLAAGPNPTLFGQPVTLTAAVSPGDATGTVEYFDGAASLGTAPVGAGGTATLVTSTLPVGSHSLTAQYGGDIGYLTSTSPTVVQVVNHDPPPNVHVLFPNGGETLLTGAAVTFRWTAAADPPVDSVSLEISRNYGIAWESLSPPVPNTGSFATELNGVMTNSCTDPVYSALFRVVAHAPDGTAGEDVSDGTFNVFDIGECADPPCLCWLPSITLTSPNGPADEMVAGGEAHITWSATSPFGGSMTIDLFVSNDLGATFHPIATGLANTGSDTWTVDPAYATNDGSTRRNRALIVALAHDATGQEARDESDAPFGIVDLATPTLLEALRAAVVPEGIELRWRIDAAAGAGSVTIERASAAAGPWLAVVAEVRTDEAGSVAVDHSTLAGEAYFYRIVVALGGGGSATFGPVPATAGTLRRFTLTAVGPTPTGGRPVRIEYTVARATDVRLGVFDLQGRRVAALADGMRSAGRHAIEWTPEVPSGLYLVRYDAAGTRSLGRLVVTR